MFKKTFAAVAVAAAFLFAGASAATAADSYTPTVTVTASPASISIGGTSTISATYNDPNGAGEVNVVFAVTPATGGSVASIVRTAASTTKPTVNGVATSTFTAEAAGTYTVTATVGDVSGSTTVTVAASGSSTGGSTLPSTGGQVPAAAIWIGAGAIGLGGLAVVAATARRRAQQR